MKLEVDWGKRCVQKEWVGEMDGTNTGSALKNTPHGESFQLYIVLRLQFHFKIKTHLCWSCFRKIKSCLNIGWKVLIISFSEKNPCSYSRHLHSFKLYPVLPDTHQNKIGFILRRSHTVWLHLQFKICRYTDTNWKSYFPFQLKGLRIWLQIFG